MDKILHSIKIEVNKDKNDYISLTCDKDIACFINQLRDVYKIYGKQLGNVFINQLGNAGAEPIYKYFWIKYNKTSGEHIISFKLKEKYWNKTYLIDNTEENLTINDYILLSKMAKTEYSGILNKDVLKIDCYKNIKLIDIVVYNGIELYANVVLFFNLHQSTYNENKE